MIALCAVVLSLEGHATVIVRDGVYYDLNYETKTASVTSGDRKYQGEVYIDGWVESDGIRFDVTEIGKEAFRRCIWLTYVSMPTTIISIGELAFADCDQLASVRMSESLTTIESNAFKDCTSLTSITLPKSLKAIGAYAFFHCAELTSIIIPDSVTSIGSNAFALCSKLKSLTIPNSVTDLGDLVCYNCIRLASVTIGESVTSIGRGAFSFCNALESVIIGKSVRSIGSEAFYQTHLSSVTIPNSVTSIGESAFRECMDLKSVIIGNSVTKIDKYAFKDCPCITNIVCCAETVPIIDDYTFNFFASTLFVPYNLIDSYKNSSQWRFDRIIGFTGVPTESISLSHTDVALQSGEEFQLLSTVLPEAAANNPLIWNSSDPAIASVDSNGLVRAVSVGEATISASFANVATSCVITVEPTPISGLSLSQTSVNLKVTEEFQLTATIYPETTTDKTVTWSSSNPEVATVDATGKVTAISIGESIVTASCGDVKATCTVTVVATPAEGITLSQETASLEVAETIQLTATVSPEMTTDKTVAWSSSNPEIATVDASGNVTAISIGETIVTASCGAVKASCNIKVEPTAIQSISLNPSNWSGFDGESFTISASISPVNATDKTLEWTSSDETIAIVDNNGNVNIVGIGECIITVAAIDGSGVTATCAVTVNPILVESVSLDPTEWSGVENSQFRITAIVLPENATDKTLEWTSSDDMIATVDDTGLVSVQKEGSCIISVKTTDGSDIVAECKINSTSGIGDVFIGADEKFDIYNIAGIIIKKECSSQNLKELLPGAYILRQGSEIRKIIIR